jgi:hypothetical protein
MSHEFAEILADARQHRRELFNIGLCPAFRCLICDSERKKFREILCESVARIWQ